MNNPVDYASFLVFLSLLSFLQYPVLEGSSHARCEQSSWLLLLPRLPVTSIIPSISCFRRQFPHKMWPIQLTFLHFTVCRIFLLSLTPFNTSFLTWSVQLISILPQHHVSKHSRYFWSTFGIITLFFSTAHNYSLNISLHIIVIFSNIRPSLLPWRWRQHVTPKQWYVTTNLHVVMLLRSSLPLLSQRVCLFI